MTMPTTNQKMSGPHRVEPRPVLNKGLDFPDGPECYGRPAAADCRRGGCALLVAAGLGSPARHALISLLALNGLRVSEATGADIEHLGLERGHRTLTVTRKGGKVVTIPLAPRTAQAIDLAIREQTEGPVFLARDGRRLDRHGVGRIVRKTACSAGTPSWSPAHPAARVHHRRAGCRGAAAGRARGCLACRSADHECGMTGPAAASTGTRLTTWPPTSQAPRGNTSADGSSAQR